MAEYRRSSTCTVGEMLGAHLEEPLGRAMPTTDKQKKPKNMRYPKGSKMDDLKEYRKWGVVLIYILGERTALVGECLLSVHGWVTRECPESCGKKKKVETVPGHSGVFWCGLEVAS